MKIIPNGAPSYILFSIYFAGYALIVAMKAYSKFRIKLSPQIPFGKKGSQEYIISEHERIYKRYAIYMGIFLIIRSILENLENINRLLSLSVDLCYITTTILAYIQLFNLMSKLQYYAKDIAETEFPQFIPESELERLKQKNP